MCQTPRPQPALQWEDKKKGTFWEGQEIFCIGPAQQDACSSPMRHMPRPITVVPVSPSSQKGAPELTLTRNDDVEK